MLFYKPLISDLSNPAYLFGEGEVVWEIISGKRYWTANDHSIKTSDIYIHDPRSLSFYFSGSQSAITA